MGKDEKTMSGAWGLWDRICADSRIVFLPEPDDLMILRRSSVPVRWYPVLPSKFGPTLIFWLLLLSQV